MNRRRSRARLGFSVPELLMALAISATLLLATMVVPLVQRFGHGTMSWDWNEISP